MAALSEASLFGDDLPEPEPPKRAAKKATPKPPRQPTAKELRERAPEIKNRAPEKKEMDPGLATLLKSLAQHDMLSPEDMDKHSDLIESVLSKSSRDRMKDWRARHGR